MGKIWMPGGGSGVDLDLVTVTGPEILEGTSAIGPDGEVIEGEMPERGSHQEATSVSLWTDPNTNKTSLYLRTKGGHYGGGTWPEDPQAEAVVRSEQSVIAQAVGLTSNKILADQSVLGMLGTATADATATDSQILLGYTAYVKGKKVAGSATVQSILSFSCAVYSSTAISFGWQNPVKGAYSGVIIVGKTGSYPTSITDGTRYYVGAGDNTAANGYSSVTIDNFGSGITYYFRAFSYAIKDGAEWIHETSYTSIAETTKGQVVLTTSGSWTVPAGVRGIDIFCVGGGAGGNAGENSQSSSGNPWYSGGGGGAGYTSTLKTITVSPGQQFAITIGAGGAGGVYNDRYGKAGGTTSFAGLLSATGGRNGVVGTGGPGGSGGGSGTTATGGGPSSPSYGGNGGENGANGTADSGDTSSGGTGQGKTTRAFGENTNAIYAGGGGGGGGINRTASDDGADIGYNYGGIGGAGGGGIGAGTMNGNAVAGTANTGSGGGGGCKGYGSSLSDTAKIAGAAGGSGVVIVRWGY